MPLQHELHKMPDVVGKLLWAIKRELEPLGWRLTPIRSGYNSYYLHKPGTIRQYHFRWRGGNLIEVLNRYRHGKVLTTIQTEREVLRFIVKVRSGKL